MLYLYEKPYLVRDTVANRHKYLSETLHLNEFEREDERAIKDTILKFCIQKKYIVYGERGAEQGVDSNLGSFLWALVSLNMRSLIDKKQHVLLLNAMESQENLAMNQILDIHTRLGCMFPTEHLNTLAHRVMTTIQTIDYPVDKEEDETSWEEIHEESPFIWLVIYIQTLLRTELKEIF